MSNLKIFIDAEYVLQSLRSIQNKPKGINITKDNFDWLSFVNFLANGRTVDSVSYYTARLDENENKETFDGQTEYLHNLEKILAQYNFKLRLGKMNKTRIKQYSTWNQDRKNKTKDTAIVTWVQKGIDSKIILDLCEYAFTANKTIENVAVIITGDEDFAEAIEKLNDLHIKTELITFERKDSHFSKVLKESATSTKSLSYIELKDAEILKS